MSLANSRLVTLRYGREGQFACEIDARRIAASHEPPPVCAHFGQELADALAHPLDFPPLEQAVIPDDHVTLALDRHTPEAESIVAATWSILARRGVAPENVLILQPASLVAERLPDPRLELPERVRNRVGWKVHDPHRRSDCAYLASTISGERIYLAREVIDADVVVSIGQTSFDPVMGYRGTNSVFYPGLSSSESLARALGQGHLELGPDDERPLRQVVDEVGWLLGTQFTIQVLAAGGGRASRVLAGSSDSVYRRCRELLAESWLVELESRPQMVIAAVDEDAAGHGWEQIGAALAVARSLVARDGKIVVLSELKAALGPGMEMVRQSEAPRDVIKPLRHEAPPDLIAATQLASAVDWARVYLLSGLESDLVEELFMIPLDSHKEVTRLLGNDESCVFLGGAQHTFGRIA